LPLNIKNREVESLAAEVATLANETKTEAIRRALLDRKQRLLIRRTEPSKKERLLRALEDHIWPAISAGQLGRPISKRERERILGYGKHGY